MYINKIHGAAVRRYNSTKTGLHRAPPELWPQLVGDEVRGPSSEAVSAPAVMDHKIPKFSIDLKYAQFIRTVHIYLICWRPVEVKLTL
jgi:hypothetical protein